MSDPTQPVPGPTREQIAEATGTLRGFIRGTEQYHGTCVISCSPGCATAKRAAEAAEIVLALLPARPTRQQVAEPVLFVNELGNEVAISVEVGAETVTVHASGPTSSTEHTWTHREAAVLRDLLPARPSLGLPGPSSAPCGECDTPHRFSERCAHPSPSDDDQWAELRELLDKATPGPWDITLDERSWEDQTGERYALIDWTITAGVSGEVMGGTNDDDDDQIQADVKYATAAANAVPALLAERNRSVVPGPTREPEVVRVAMSICRPCLDGVGQECHTPGCALWMHKVDLPIGPEFYDLLPARPSRDLADDDRTETYVNWRGEQAERRVSPTPADLAKLHDLYKRARRSPGCPPAHEAVDALPWLLAEIERLRAHQGTT